MKLTKKLEAEILKTYNQCWEAYLAGDLKTHASFLSKQFKIIGTSESEQFNSKKEWIAYCKKTIKQFAGVIRLRNRKFRLQPARQEVMVTENSDIYALINNKWNFYSRIRISALLQKEKGGWKYIHQHGSLPDARANEGEVIATEQIKKENLQLREAVKRRTVELEQKNRELEIETALEKVRAIAMSMKEPADMLKICKTISQQLVKLGVKEIRNVQTAIFYESRGTYMNYEYYAKHDKTIITDTTYTNNKIHKAFAAKMLKGRGQHFVTHIKGKKVKEWLAYQKTTNVFIDKYLKTASSLNYYWHSLGPVALGVSTYAPLNKEEEELVVRFRNVFELSYRRYLDIEQATAQAREAQIEAALERVRSRSMAMHKSEELKEVIKVVLEQFVHLNINVGHSGFYIDYKTHDDMHIWLADPNIEPFFAIIPYFDTPTWNSFLEAKAKARLSGGQGTILHTDLLDFKEKNKFYKKLFKLFTIPEDAQKFYLQCKGLAVSTVLLDHVGLYIENFEAIPYTDEENAILMRFGKVFQQTYTRFLDLQKAEAQAREAKIEAALERVRSRSMAMHKSEELADLSLELVKQVQALGVTTWFCAFNIYDDDPQGSLEWGSNGQGTFPRYRTPREGIFLRYYEAGQKGETLLINEIGENECPAHYEYLCTLPGVGEQLLAMKAAGIPFPSFQIDHVAFFKYGYLLFITYEPVPESHDIFKRFAKVFEQSYTRFLDLQKAEAQAREAQIEAALERVRAKAMAMHKSDDLNGAVAIMFEEFQKLNLDVLRCGIGVLNKDARTGTVWTTSVSDNGLAVQISANESFDTHQLMMLNYECWQKQEDLDYVLEGQDLINYYKAMDASELKLPKSQLSFSDDELQPQYYYAAMFNAGGLYAFRDKPFAAEDRKIMKRFASVVNLTYNRFLDLQKAEAQAREAQIEAALEKVRSRSLAMHHSDELEQVAASLFDRLTELGLSFDGALILIFEKERRNIRLWVATNQLSAPVKIELPYDEEIKNNAIIKDLWNAIENGKHIFNKSYSGETKNDYFRYVQKYNESRIPEAVKQIQLENESWTACFAAEKNSVVGFDSWSGHIMKEEDFQISIRFARVFEQAYTRFLDLQKAEAQAREAQIEAALERIRSKVTAMQESSELLDIVVSMRREFVGLNHEAGYFWYMRWLPDKYEKAMTSGDGSRIGMVMTLPRHIHGDIKLVADWEKSNEPALVFPMDIDTAVEYVDKMITLGDFQQVDPQAPTLDDIRHIGGLTFVMARTTYGEIGFSLAGEVDEPPKESLDTLIRFAAVFDLAYRRFNDLQIAEAHARQAEQDLIAIKEAKQKAEEALTELQATQKQLIQSEKMASLGELTAGIAHEIQNPLNFVNNFSEVSKELLDEMKEAIEKGDAEEAKEIMNDVIQNLEKINHHGKRADGIVKGMLQHSRSSTGQKELTDINALCDEYLRLAYHGLRAKDKSFNAKFETGFDETIGKINVMPQDIGRVILNLINNAFYAVTERKKAGEAGYEPTVVVSTKKQNGNVTISVRDNGTGIPQKVLDKIFQPFFTTKPTGQGTGLGLSLSYDITTKGHGGDLKVETKEGEFTQFTIILPYKP